MRRKIKTNTELRRTKVLAPLIFLLFLRFAHPALAHYESLKLLASDANADDRFGVSVAIDGNTVVVGAYQNDSNGPDSGAAYVYELSGPVWIERQKLTASDGSAGAQFGRSVAIQGDTIVVGAYLDDNNDSNTGSAYVFTRSGDLWSQQQKLIASDAATDDKFGISVAIDNDTIVVGAYGDDKNTGAAYVFARNGSAWYQQQKLNASGPGDLFGASVSISNNTIIVGAYGDDGYTGAVYVFVRNGSDWSQDCILRASDSINNDMFGWSVAIDGNWAVVGAYCSDYSENVTDTGSAYIFQRSGSAWFQRQKIIDPNQPNQSQRFGFSVAVHNDRIAIGCKSDLVADQNAGSVYSYSLDGSNWIYRDRLLASDANEGDTFGLSVALSADHVIVGSPYNSDNGPSSGSAYIFDNFLVSDFDSDSDVDFRDYAKLVACWLQNDPLRDVAPPPAGDGIVDLEDLAVLCDNWLACK
jgi:hypothetical protein